MNIALLCNSWAWGGLEMNYYKLAIWLTEAGNNVFARQTPGWKPNRRHQA